MNQIIKKMRKQKAEQMRKLVKAYRNYSGSKKSFCEERGIAVHTLSYWCNKYRDEGSMLGDQGFVALQIEDTLAIKGTISLYYPSGVRAVLPLSTPIDLLSSLIKLES